MLVEQEKGESLFQHFRHISVLNRGLNDIMREGRWSQINGQVTGRVARKSLEKLEVRYGH